MGAIFISYRRGDSEGQARALYADLSRHLGKDSVFMDVDSIALGRDFRHVLQERLSSCDMVLALIGPDWIDITDEQGNRRLDSPTDFVRQELSAALKRGVPVTPVLVQGARIPPPERLPDDIKDLAEPTLAHRIIVSPSARMRNIDARGIVREILSTIPVPGGTQTPVPAEAGGRWRSRRSG